MPVARSMEQLQKQIVDEMEKAMHQVEKKSIKRVDDAMLYFYKGGTPVVYKRTGHLMDTRETDPVYRSALDVQYRIFLNEGIGGYTSGSRPSMTAVLNLTNYGYVQGLRPAVGNLGWWHKAEREIKFDFEKIFARHFH